ncbi:MAG: T9SS type A sorting domain-containing protein [Bacteroidales bacterium]|jgi:hypothetical protein|nr:T9SS type A sorting domain-containing protein [Bacteroidales bacterium]
MKKYNIIAIVLLFFAASTTTVAQDFSFRLYLETANGGKDTLELGYDPTSTWGADSIFDEISYNSPVNINKFEAFVGVSPTQDYDGNYTTFQKKEIVPINLGWCSAIHLIVPFDSVPIKVSWDKTLFNNDERYRSVITDWYPGGWFDVGPSTFLENMRDTDSVIVDTMYVDKYYQIFYYDDTIPFLKFYVAFWSKQGFAIEDKNLDVSRFSLYPNPVTDVCYIRSKTTAAIKNIFVYTLQGQHVLSFNSKITEFDCSSLRKGIYIVTVETEDKAKQYCKMIKN